MIKNHICVQLLGAGLPNRGAELMVRTVMDQFKQRYSNCTFCIDQNIPDAELELVGLLRKVPFKRNPLQRIITPFLPKYKNYVKENEVNVIIDISGFAYGDFWGEKKLYNRLFRCLPLWEKNNTPLFILPQAFGPFTEANFPHYFKAVASYADLFCARDSQSYEYLQKLGLEGVQRYKDITLSYSEKETISLPESPYSLVIPNTKILESDIISKEDYIAMITRFVNKMKDQQITPILLNHEGRKDLQLCKEISKLLGIDYINPKNSLEIKYLISHSKLVFTSRYHGLISSLETGVVPIVFGWSHKYKEILSEFNLTHLLITDPQQELDTLLNSLVEPELKNIQRSIKKQSAKAKLSLEAMWEELFSKLQ